LTLAQGQRGIDRAETFDLASVAAAVLGSREGTAAAHRVELSSALAPVTISGDARLVTRLVSNLVDNAIRYNVPGGRVDVSVRSGGRATLTVANTGTVVPEAEVQRLMQPFQRLSPDRTSQGDGLGLGLSIVAAVAGAHDAVLAVRARPEGGLEIDVDFPARATPVPTRAPTSPDQPRPTNGMAVAMIVMNSTLASSGRPAMCITASAAWPRSIIGSAARVPPA
jgi:signal transduction histidine kinase